MNRFIGNYRWGIVCAVLSGIILVLPQFVLPLSIGKNYQGIPPLMLDNEDVYRARIHEILDGYPSVSSPYFHEYKQTSAMVVPPINEWIYAIPAYIFGLTFVVVLSKFLFPALLFFFVYFLLRKLLTAEDRGEVELAALTGAFLVVMGIDFVDYHHLAQILKGDVVPGAMLWERLVNPITGALELFGFLILLVYSLRGSYKVATLTGAVLSLTVGYFFTFALSYCILGSLILFYLLKGEKEKIKILFAIVGVSILLDIPYWWSVLHSVGGDGGKLLASRNGMNFTHDPVINKMLLASSIFFVCLFFIGKRTKQGIRDKQAWVFAGALLFGSWGVYNQQIITGREIWYHHFVQYVIPLSYLAIVIGLFYSVRIIWPKFWHISSQLLVVILLSYGLFTSWGGAIAYKPEFMRQQAFSTVFDHLDGHSDGTCTVLVHAKSETLEKAIPAYTDCDVYSSSYVFIGVPEKRVTHNFLINMRLDGVNEENSETYLLSHESEIRSIRFSNWDELFASGNDIWFTDQAKLLNEEYKAFTKQNLKEELLNYKMDYLVTDLPLPTQVIAELPGLHLTKTTGKFYIYEF